MSTRPEARARRRAVFLDRDGVLNRSPVLDGKPRAPRTVEAFRLLPGTSRAVLAIKRAGYLAVVVTNQPDIGNGVLDATTVEHMHRRLRDRLKIDDILTCPHSQSTGCDCRKPKPGMLLDAAHKWAIDLTRSYMVGDRASDMAAGRAAGCYTVLVDRRYPETRDTVADARVTTLPNFVRLVLERRTGAAK